MRYLFKVAVVFACLCGSVQAGAFGPYAGAGYGEFHYESREDVLQEAIRLKEKEDAWRVYAGFRFLSFLAAEGSYADLGQIEARAPVGEVEARAKSLAASLIAFVPIGRIELFAKLGAASWEVDTRLRGESGEASRTADGTNASYGGGAKMPVMDNLYVRAEWERIEFDEDADGEFWTAGLMYTF